MRLAHLVASFALVSAALHPVTAQPEMHESTGQHDARMAWWREARFGMFIHWGAYAVPAGSYRGVRVPGLGEWIMNDAHIPVAEYEQLVHQFNPAGFDAEEWVRAAKGAG